MDMILPIGRPTQAAQMEVPSTDFSIGRNLPPWAGGHPSGNKCCFSSRRLARTNRGPHTNPSPAERPENGKLKGAPWITAGSAPKQLTRREPSELKPQNTGPFTP
ncbi:hypothetical protein ACLOJK_017916 [Asimina triloba]